jgi:histidinol-phosphate aminotransferase
MSDWDRLVRPSLHGLQPYRPGASVAELKRRHGLRDVAKLNWNENLFGPLPGVLEAAAAELPNLWMYPEQAYADFRSAVAAWLGVAPELVVPSHGIQSLVGTVAAALLEPGDAVVVPAITYGLYAQVSAAHGARLAPVPLRDLRIDLEAMARAARSLQARLVWLCDPNNPTGSLLAAEEWRRFLEQLPERCVVAVDEAYMDFVEPELRPARAEEVAAGRPLICLRSFSKLFGLAGLRLGYALAHPRLAHYLDIVQEPFNVNRVALVAGQACLRDATAVEARRRAVAEARRLLCELLVEAGCQPVPSQANFVLAQVGVDDRALAEGLAERGFLIRPGHELGLPGYARITVGPPPLMERLAEELKRLLPRLAAQG